ncbi:MAG: fibronectin type III domain-containing protein, partial [Oligoflexales bacterium]|nr:fibronectin type III domain-containing protein [Oligoflexales bacterium]
MQGFFNALFVTFFSVALTISCAEDDVQYLESERTLVDLDLEATQADAASDGSEEDEHFYDDSEGALQPGMISGSYLVQCEHYALTGGVACKFLNESTNKPITDLSPYSFSLLDGNGNEVGSKAKFSFDQDSVYSFFIDFQEDVIDWKLAITRKNQDGAPGTSNGIVVPLKEKVYFLSETKIIVNGGNPIADTANVPVKVADAQARKIGFSKDSCETLRWVNLSSTQEASLSLLSEGDDKGYVYFVVESDTGAHSNCFLKFLEFDSMSLQAPEIVSFSMTRQSETAFEIHAGWSYESQENHSGYVIYVGSQPGLDNILNQETIAKSDISVVRQLQLTPGHQYYLQLRAVDQNGQFSQPAEQVFEATFEANDLSDLMLWLDASELDINQPITQWNDKGPHAFHFTPTEQTKASSLRTLTGKPGVHFSGQSQSGPMKELLRNDSIDVRQAVRPTLSSVAVFQKHANTFPEVPTIWTSVQNADTKRVHSMGAAPEDKAVVEILEFVFDATTGQVTPNKCPTHYSCVIRTLYFGRNGCLLSFCSIF